MQNDRRDPSTQDSFFRREIFEMMVNRTAEILILFSVEDYSVDYVSPNIERLLGISEDEIRADFSRLTATSVEPEKMLSEEELVKAISAGNGSRLRERIHQKTGQHVWFQETFLRGRFKDSRKFVLFLSDRTQEVMARAQLEQALAIARSANEGKSAFLANMSHDIRTPMNAIIGFSHLLEKEWDKPARVREYAHKITASSRCLLILLNDLLDMSRIESGKATINKEEFRLGEFLDNLQGNMRPLARAKNHSFELLAKGVRSEALIGDKHRLYQILYNLLSNAIKYTPDFGTITFIVTQLEQTSRRLARFRFEISDNGIGMDPEFLKHVFEPFARERNSTASGIPGTGLGLALVKNLVVLMGGTVHVESEQGIGTTFVVELEFQLAEQSIDKDFWEEKRIVRLLTVDDEEYICKDIEASMSGTGVEVQSVNSGEKAIALVRQADLDGEPFDMILLDWKMPAMDGIETAKRIREAGGASTPLLILTAYDWSDIEDTARNAGIDGFLAKPFFITNFQHTVELLGSDGAEQQEADASKNILSGLRILAAEDNDFNAEILCELLTMEGAQCDLAENGKIALEKFEASQEGYYDVILMDVRMPVMDGHEATRAIRASSHPDAKKILISAMTANTFAEDVQAALESGMDAHMAKPLDIDTLKVELHRLLKQRRQD